MRIDCHCDTALWLLKSPSLLCLPEAHQDYQRISRYLDLAFMDIFINENEYAHEMPEMFQQVLNLLLADIAKHRDLVCPLLWREQLDKPSGQTLLLIAAEGAASLGRECQFLEQYYAAGLRLIGLTWNGANRYAGGCASSDGLTDEGQLLVAHCNQLGILLDGAHLNRRSFWQLLEQSRQPIIVSHTCCDALYHHRRNLDDEQILALAEQDGVVGVTFVPDFLGGAGDLTRLCEHIEHAVTLVGSSHVALGSDFDGCTPVAELNGLEKLPLLYDTLAKRGMATEDIANIAGKSVMNLLRKILPSSASL